MNLGVLGPPSSTILSSHAFGVSNSGAVVGSSETAASGGSTTHAFVWLPDAVFGPAFPAGQSEAFAVRNPESAEEPPEIAGISRPCGPSASCDGTDDPVVWQEPVDEEYPAAYVPELSFDPDLRSGRVLGINDHDTLGELVGACGTVDECKTHAVYWEDRDAVPVDLHQVYLPGDPSSESVANAIRNRGADGSVEVVGTDLTAGQGVIWRQSSPDAAWEAGLLSEEISDLCGWDRLQGARDVNDDGWIVGTGDADLSPNQRVRAYLLIPIPCFAELSGEEPVDGADLGILLAAWGACQAGSDCTYCAFSSIEAFVAWSDTADASAIQALGVWLETLTIGGGV